MPWISVGHHVWRQQHRSGHMGARERRRKCLFLLRAPIPRLPHHPAAILVMAPPTARSTQCSPIGTCHAACLPRGCSPSPCPTVFSLRRERRGPVRLRCMLRLSTGICARHLLCVGLSSVCSQGHVLTGSFGAQHREAWAPASAPLVPSLSSASLAQDSGRMGEVTGQWAVHLGAHHRKGSGKT